MSTLKLTRIMDVNAYSIKTGSRTTEMKILLERGLKSGQFGVSFGSIGSILRNLRVFEIIDVNTYSVKTGSCTTKMKLPLERRLKTGQFVFCLGSIGWILRKLRDFEILTLTWPLTLNYDLHWKYRYIIWTRVTYTTYMWGWMTLAQKLWKKYVIPKMGIFVGHPWPWPWPKVNQIGRKLKQIPKGLYPKDMKKI